MEGLAITSSPTNSEEIEKSGRLSKIISPLHIGIYATNEIEIDV